MTTAPPWVPVLDIHALVVRALRGHAGVGAIAGQRIYARTYNERQQFPACRVSFPASTGASIPAPAWWDYDGQVDCHAQNHQQGLALAQQVHMALLEMTGTTHPEGWVANVDAWSVQSGFDEEFTPPKPRWIVAATFTARTRQEE